VVHGYFSFFEKILINVSEPFVPVEPKLKVPLKKYAFEVMESFQI